MHQCAFSVCVFVPLCCDSRQNRSVLWHLIETPSTMTPLQWNSCLQLLSHPPPTYSHCSLAPFLPRSLLPSLNHPSFSVSHLFLSIFLNHLLPYCSPSPQILHSSHPSFPSVRCLPPSYHSPSLPPASRSRFFPLKLYSNGSLCHPVHFRTIPQSSSVYIWKSDIHFWKSCTKILHSMSEA